MDDSRAGSPPSPAMRYPRVGRIMLIAGNLLMLATFFVPWLELETSFCASGPRCRYLFGSWYLIQPGIPDYQFLSQDNPFLTILACEVIILVCSVVCLTSHSRKVQRFSLGALCVPCALCLFITFAYMTLLSIGMALSYPFFHTDVASGSWLALVSFLGIFAAAGLVWPE